jgi:hypothetical protein
MPHLTHWLHSLNWGDVPAWVAAVVAVIFGVLSWRSARKSKAERKQAERATKAAERYAAAAERSAAVEEKQLELAQKDADAAERYPWYIERRSDGDFLLHTRTDTPKYNVDVTGDPANAAEDGSNHFEIVHGRSPVALDLYITAQSDDTVVVSWHPTPDHTGEAWTQPIDL